MNASRWYTTLYPWHYVFVLALAYVLWQALARYRLRSKDHLAARLNYINYFVALSFGILSFACFLYIYHSDTPTIPKSLLHLCFLTWSATVCLILWRPILPKPIRVVSFVVVLGAVLIQYLYGQGVAGFLTVLDNFVALGGKSDGGGLKISMFLKWFFFFTHAFVVLHFYGLMYEISYREKVRRGERIEGLQEDAIDRAILVMSMGFAFFVALVLTGAELGKLSLFSGLVAAGVSIALRDMLSNMAAGVFLLWDKSIKLKDVIALDKERFGIVKSMTMRYLILEDRNDIRFLIPNSDLINRTITNWTHSSRRIRLKLEFGVAYGSELDKVKDVIKAICLRHPRVLQDPPPRILIIGLGDSIINFQLRFFIDDPENGIRNVSGELYELLLQRFKDSGISIPLPQQEIRLLPNSNLNVMLHKRQSES